MLGQGLTCRPLAALPPSCPRSVLYAQGAGQLSGGGRLGPEGRPGHWLYLEKEEFCAKSRPERGCSSGGGGRRVLQLVRAPLLHNPALPRSAPYNVGWAQVGTAGGHSLTTGKDDIRYGV